MIYKWYRGAAYGSALFIFAGLLTGCATQPPIGPTVSVMPAPGKPFDVFSVEDQQCRQYASQSTGLTPGQTSYGNFAGSAAAGTVIGAVAGQLIGGNQGAGVGAGMGLLAGSAQGSNQAQGSTQDAQWRYNNAYKQCMYAKGNQVPGYQYQRQVAPPPPNYPPPPPQE